MPSTVISRIHYDHLSSTLRIVFVSGIVYEYKKVPEKVYMELKAAASKGSYFNQNIKPHYACKKVIGG